jgi:glycosyltransferase involved in cell wall biosynthesis
MSFKWSIIMCCYNSVKRIDSALLCIFNQDYIKHAPIELVIVDNNSSDNLKEHISKLNIPDFISINYVFESEPGLSYARKSGVLASSGDYICWIDDDNDIAHDYLNVANEIFDSENKICFIGGKSDWPNSYKKSDAPKFVSRFAKAVAVGKQRQYSEGYIELGDFLWGAGLCMRRSVVLGLYKSGFQPILTGRLGESILSGEDGELTILLQLSGGLGYYSDRLYLEHRVDKSRFTYSYFTKLFFGMGLAYPTLRAYRRKIRINDQNQYQYLLQSKNILKTTKDSETNQNQTSLANYCFFIFFGIFFISGIVKGWIRGLHSDAPNNVKIVLNYYKSFNKDT